MNTFESGNTRFLKTSRNTYSYFWIGLSNYWVVNNLNEFRTCIRLSCGILLGFY